MPTKPEFVRVRTIVLIGFMAAGKTTVGRILAGQLGWSFCDLDDEIERHTGSSVRDFFRTRGESAFRELEQHLVAGLLDRTEIVVAPGGGWAASPQALDSMPASARAVWLKVSAQEAVRRAGMSGSRPLLDVPDPLATAERLLADREPFYALAHWQVEVDTRSPEEVAEEILELYRKNSK